MPTAPEPSRGTGATGRARLEWVDATRGYCVLAVVLTHVILWGYRDVSPGTAGLGLEAWGAVDRVLGSVRMPVLLAVSGLLLSRRIRTAPLRGGPLRSAATNYYLYVVWLGVYALFYAVVRQPDLRHRVDGALELLSQLVVPETTLWYLFALAVYTIVLWAVRRVPPPVVLLGAAAVTVVVHTQDFPGHLWPKVPELVVFFAAGVYGADLVRRLAERAGASAVVLTAAAAVGTTALGRVDGAWFGSVVFIVRGLAFMAFAVVVVSLAVRWRPLRSLGVRLGRQTLGVYVLHPLLIALVTVATATGPARAVLEAVLAHPAGALAYPPALTAAIVAVSVPARGLAQRVGAGWLFAMPERWAQALGRPAGPAAARAAAPPA